MDAELDLKAYEVEERINAGRLRREEIFESKRARQKEQLLKAADPKQLHIIGGDPGKVVPIMLVDTEDLRRCVRYSTAQRRHEMGTVLHAKRLLREKQGDPPILAAEEALRRHSKRATHLGLFNSCSN